MNKSEIKFQNKMEHLKQILAINKSKSSQNSSIFNEILNERFLGK